MIKDLLKHTLRNGKVFKKFLREIAQMETYSIEELREYQNEKLRNIIRMAYEEVPYYNKTFKERKIKVSDIKSKEDLNKLPFINKKIVQENIALFRNRNYKGPVFKGYTSGTTGTPGQFLRDMRSVNYEQAIIARQLQWAGIKQNDKRISLRGDRIFRSERLHPPFWKYSFLEKKMIMSSYHLSDNYLPLYIDKIKQFKPRLLQAYPSTAYILAQYLEKANDYIQIPVIQTSSEPMYDHWRELIEKRFIGKVFDFYGQAERVVFGKECEEHNGLHIMPNYSCFELVDKQTGQVSDTKGTIIGTTINNYLMPLIRYQTDDFGEIIEEPCKCGRPFIRIKSIETKAEHMIFAGDGKIISPSLITFPFKSAKGIKKSQIIQKKDLSIEIKIVKEDGFNEEIANELIRKMQNIVGENPKVNIELVNEIGCTKNGKYQWILSEKAQNF